jgi:HSP20 family molecular chaperone IbpA
MIPPCLDSGEGLSKYSFIPAADAAHRVRQAGWSLIPEDAVTRLSLFNSPLLLGFDDLERVMDRVSKASSDGYPPYNIEKTGEHSLRISLAVAGFTMNDLSVTIEDNQLVVRGRQGDDGGDRIFLHRGIASRQFQRAFVLAEGIEVTAAFLDSGLLHIDMERPVPDVRVRNIPINTAGKTGDASGETIDVAPSRKAIAKGRSDE